MVSNICCFHPVWGDDPIWLIFFRWVGSTTNQFFVLHKCPGNLQVDYANIAWFRPDIPWVTIPFPEAVTGIFFYIFRRGSRTKPSFATWEGGQHKIYRHTNPTWPNFQCLVTQRSLMGFSKGGPFKKKSPFHRLSAYAISTQYSVCFFVLHLNW